MTTKIFGMEKFGQCNVENKHDAGAHYRFEYHGVKLDPYRIADIYRISNHAQFSALKKILCAGNRGKKDLVQDLIEAKAAIDRWLEMIVEDGAAD